MMAINAARSRIQAASLTFKVSASNSRSMAYAFDARGSLCSPRTIREIVPCGTPVQSLMAVCVQPNPIKAEIFSEVFMPSTIRKHIEKVNTLSHYALKNNGKMEFRDWLKVEMANQVPPMGPSDLARLAKIPQPTIFRILSGETKNPRIDKVRKIERVLKSQSPALEQVDEFPELIAAWRLLSPTQQAELMSVMHQHISRNQEVLATFGRGSSLPKRRPKIIDPTLPEFNEFTDYADQRKRERREAQAKVQLDRRQGDRRINESET